MMRTLGKACAAICGLAFVGLAVLYFIADTGTSTVHLQCDGMVRERFENSDIPANRARLGLTFEKFDAIVFWAEEKQRYSYSLVFFRDDGSVSRHTGTAAPFEQYNSIYASAGVLGQRAGADRPPAFFYDNQAGLAQLVLFHEVGNLSFDGLCQRSRQAIE